MFLLAHVGKVGKEGMFLLTLVRCNMAVAMFAVFFCLQSPPRPLHGLLLEQHSKYAISVSLLLVCCIGCRSSSQVRLDGFVSFRNSALLQCHQTDLPYEFFFAWNSDGSVHFTMFHCGFVKLVLTFWSFLLQRCSKCFPLCLSLESPEN